jgi:hypothetical protein
VPQATIDRMVALNVQDAELFSLWNSGEIDRGEWITRKAPGSAELDRLKQQLRQFSRDEQQQANSQIKGLTEARIALLKPQWQAKAVAFKRQSGRKPC